MSRDGVRNLLLVGLLVLGGWGLTRALSRWGANVPQQADAATQMLGKPYVADPETGYFHRRRCPAINPGGGRATFARKNTPEDLVGYDSRADAIADRYMPCEECNP